MEAFIEVSTACVPWEYGTWTLLYTLPYKLLDGLSPFKKEGFAYASVY